MMMFQAIFLTFMVNVQSLTVKLKMQFGKC